jgi:hypothetical protein
MNRSIQILGPRSEAEELLLPVESVLLNFDVNQSNPLEDLWCLIRRPKVFFSALRFGPQKISSWAWGKAIFGALIAIWISEILTQDRFAPEDLFRSLASMDPRILAYAEYQWGLSSLLPVVGAVIAALMQFMVFAAPFFQVTVLLSSTVALCLGLRAMGIAWDKIYLDRLLLRSLYVYWVFFLTLIPGIGAPLATLAFILFSILSVRWIFNLSFWKAAWATAVVEILVSVALMVLLFVPLSALFFAFAL